MVGRRKKCAPAQSTKDSRKYRYLPTTLLTSKEAEHPVLQFADRFDMQSLKRLTFLRQIRKCHQVSIRLHITMGNRSDVFRAMLESRVLLSTRCERLEQQVAKAIVDAQNRPERKQNRSTGQERLQSRDGQKASAPQWNRERCLAPEAKDLSSNLLKL